MMRKRANVASSSASKAAAASSSTTAAAAINKPTKSPFELFGSLPHVIAEEKEGVWVGLLLAVLVFTIYTLTVYPTIPGGDSPELIVAACELGVAHPPGYPTFTILGYLFTKIIPFGSIAFRINMFSVVSGTVASFFLFHAARLWILYSRDEEEIVDENNSNNSNNSSWYALIVAGGYSFSSLVWMYSIQAEVFALNNSFVGLLLYLIAKYWQTRQVKFAILGSFSIALGLTNQHTLVFYALPVVLWVLYVGRHSLLTTRMIILLTVVALIGISPYGYIVWAGSIGPPGSWGDTATLQGFLTHFFRREYGTFRLFSGNEAHKGSQLVLALSMYLQNILHIATPLGLPLALLGCLIGLRGRNKIESAGFIYVFAYFFYMIVFHSLSNLPIQQALYYGVHMRFWMQPHAIAFMWMGFALFFIFQKVVRLPKTAVIVMACILVGCQIARNYTLMDQSRNYTIRDYGMAHLDPIPPNGVLLVKGDLITNSIRYLQCCEGVRPDIVHLDQSMMTYAWFKKTQQKHLKHIKLPNELYNPYQQNGYSLGELLDEYATIPDKPMMLCGGWYHEEPEGSGGIAGFTLWPLGPCDRIVSTAGSEVEVWDWLEESKRTMPQRTESWPIEDRVKYTDDTWEAVATTDYWGMKHKHAFHLLNQAIAANDDAGMLLECISLFDNLIAEHGEPAPEYFYKNIGIAYGRLRSFEGHAKMAEYFKKYLQSAPKDDPQTAEIKRVVNDWEKQSAGMKNSGVDMKEADAAYRQQRQQQQQQKKASISKNSNSKQQQQQQQPSSEKKKKNKK